LKLCSTGCIIGRYTRRLVERWGSYLPKYGDPPFQQAPGIPANNTASGTQLQNGVSVNGNATNGTNSQSEGDSKTDIEDDLEEDEENSNSGAVESRRNQTTAVILLGVIGALFDLEAEKEGAGDNALALGMHMTRLTAKALMYLVELLVCCPGLKNPEDGDEHTTRYINALAVKRVICIPKANALSPAPSFSASKSNSAPITPRSITAVVWFLRLSTAPEFEFSSSSSRSSSISVSSSPSDCELVPFVAFPFTDTPF
jgi:hypothetical protein